MGQGFGQAGEYLRSLSKKQVVWCLSLLVLVGFILAIFGVVRPDVGFIFSSPHIYVVNRGRLDGLITRIDGFLFWKGRVAYVGNMPRLQQTVSEGADPQALQIPKIPPVGQSKTTTGKPCYLKLAVRYQIPGIPFFRYTSLLYLEFNPKTLSWDRVRNIPGRYRSLGRVGVGDVNIIQLDFE